MPTVVSLPIFNCAVGGSVCVFRSWPRNARAAAAHRYALSNGGTEMLLCKSKIGMSLRNAYKWPRSVISACCTPGCVFQTVPSQCSARPDVSLLTFFVLQELAEEHEKQQRPESSRQRMNTGISNDVATSIQAIQVCVVGRTSKYLALRKSSLWRPII